ncbi:alpha/beta hydrolase [Ilyomonas limi]|uniref:Alpha/beta hydrolase n=1 Tax=Ilyomonas limi TaxID=2575867 RepID=A0A4V5UU08_9BACT|nr:alpha/beta hydrolase [Ilyomonas limi]TKK67243.1 alpha/beta hydrolase [Ilyomonas limi]
MQEEKVVYKNSVIAYKKYGQGNRYMLCFHGFGQTGYRWGILEPFLGNKFTLIAFDLPFHGDTMWNKQENFTVEKLVEIIKQVLPKNHDKFYLLGYSMGGRIALRLLQQIPEQIQKVVLLAPDGLHKNFLYRFATHTIVGRNIFYKSMRNPRLLFSLAKQLHARGAISKGYINMAELYMSSETSRMAIYYRWMGTRYFQPNLNLLKNQIVKYRIPVVMVFGKSDKIIIADKGILFTKGLENYTTIKLLDTGHYFLRENYAPLIASFFDDDK